METSIETAARCTGCGACLRVCPTYRASGRELLGPVRRIQSALSIIAGTQPDESLIESVYSCPGCGRCVQVCPENVPVPALVHRSRIELVRRGFGPLEKQERIIASVMRDGNAVGGDPAARLDWLPEKDVRHDSDTLLYLGCMASYLVTEAARGTYGVLKKLGLDVTVLDDEGCCGIYLYSAGAVDRAGEFFLKNSERFASLGIKKIVVPCNGCLKCFKYYYPELLGDFPFEVRHAVSVIWELIKDRKPEIAQLGFTAAYHDSCRLARGEGITEEPRSLLNACGIDLRELPENRKNAACCGSGGGIRSVYRGLSLEIAAGLIEEAPAGHLITACPFCAFNLSYASRKKRLDKKTSYFSTHVLQALEGG